MDHKTVEKLEEKIEEAIAEVIAQMGLKRLPLLTSRHNDASHGEGCRWSVRSGG
jgi:predicted RNase H-like HicB family nuclease